MAGRPEYHFILDEGNVYRLKPDETQAVLVKGLPIEPKEIRWGGANWIFQTPEARKIELIEEE